jgi:flagellin-specific chaperone FliS
MATSIPAIRSPHLHVLALWDGLLAAVTTARAAVVGGDHGNAERAVSRSCAYLSELYSTLEPTRSPIVSAHLQSVLDACLVQLGSAHADEGPARLDATLRLLGPVRAAL